MKDTNTKRRLTDEDRNTCLKLITCGLSCQEIADIVKSSRSAVAFIKQTYTACLNKDFDTLRRLSASHHSTVVWAMQLTGIEFPDDAPVVSEPKTLDNAEEKPNANDILTREFMLSTFDVLSDIRNLLTEIRDILK